VSVPLAAEASPAHLAEVAERLRQVTVEVFGTGGGGAGILWAPDRVLTNAHVVRPALAGVRLADERWLDARVIAVDPRADLALLGVARSGLTPAVLADSDAVRVGAIVVALGHPLGLRRTLTAGVVHAVAPASPGRRRWIQADLRLAPGNSGGPLADTDGAIVGITTMIAGDLALAIPSNEARRFVASALAARP
jgi:serine protease Do